MKYVLSVLLLALLMTAPATAQSQRFDVPFLTLILEEVRERCVVRRPSGLRRCGSITSSGIAQRILKRVLRKTKYNPYT